MPSNRLTPAQARVVEALLLTRGRLYIYRRRGEQAPHYALHPTGEGHWESVLPATFKRLQDLRVIRAGPSEPTLSGTRTEWRLADPAAEGASDG